MSKFGDVENLYEMSNVIKDYTGLDYVVWISTNSNSSQHGPRIKVRIDGEFIPVSIEDDPRITIATNKTIPNFNDLQKWIIMNKELLLQYWNSQGEIDIVTVIKNLRRV